MHIPGLVNASTYPFYSQESLGGLKFPDFAAVNETLTQVQPNRIMRYGEYVVDRYGNIGQYVLAGAGIAVGLVVKKMATVTGTVATADSTGDDVHVLKTTVTAATGVNSEVGNYLWIDGYGIYIILANTSGANSYITISKKDTRFGRGGYDGNALSPAASNGNKLALIRRYKVDLATTGTTPVGVGVGTIDSGKAGLVAVHGLVQVQADGTGNALTDGGVMVVSATTSGNVMGPTATETTAEVRGMVGTCLFAYTPGSSGQLVPGNVMLWGRL